MNMHGSIACWKRDVPEDRRRIARRVLGHLRVYITVANWVGALIVFAYFAWAFPPEANQDAFGTTSVNALAGLLYMIWATAFATFKAERYQRALKRWRTDDSPPNEQERREIMHIPAEMVKLSAINWVVGIPVFFLLNLDYSLGLATDVAGSILLAGLTSCAAVYLVAERITRPALAYVLDPKATSQVRSVGIAPRIVLTWALLSGVPLIGLITIPLGRTTNDPDDLIAPIAFVAGVALLVGLFGMKVVAQNIASPVRRLRDAMDRVGEGDIDIEVEVDDASEIGRLQAGFNQMLEGLRERRHLRDLFGKQVGDDVARAALEGGVTLGGQQRTVAALFIDIVGSTALAGRERPERVVDLLNGFFATVVDVVAEHGGLVNKFEGDGALCIFGAPTERDGFAASALTAARHLQTRLADSSALDAAIGVSCGTAVAGHIGAEERYEYTVIGDPVNEASRLCELAKHRPGRILASAAAVDHAGEPEASHWHIDGEVRLRGRSDPTRLAYPADLAGEHAADGGEAAPGKAATAA
jgi:adenylate cyclase